MKTPWGTSQSTRTIEPGLIWVSTSGHGGLLCTKEWATLNLSQDAQKIGETFNADVVEQLAYEEDCDYAVLAWEVPRLWPQIFTDWTTGNSEEEIKQSLWKTLSYYQPEFLIESGVPAESVAYERWQQRRQADEMRAARHPDLIVVARGSWHTKNPDTIEVGTADGKNHIVMKDSYVTSALTLLSNCVLYSPEQ